MGITGFLPVILEFRLTLLVANVMSNPIVVLANMLKITRDSTYLTLNFHLSLHLEGSVHWSMLSIKRPLKNGP